MTQAREEAQRWRDLVTGLDEAGIYTFLEGRSLKPEDAKRLEYIKKAKAISDRCDDLGKQIPLNHEDIQNAYIELRDLTSKVEELSLHQLHLA